MRLLLHNGIFFEFVPFNEDNFDEDGHIRANPRVLTIDQVEEHVDYALLITTCAGAWRYLIGDTVRFPDKRIPEIIITGRTKHFLSVCGEHLSVDNMNQGIQQLEEELDLSIREFTVGPVQRGRRYIHQWYLGCEQGANAELVKGILDQHLQLVNADYKTERENMLNIEVEILPVDTFYEWQAMKGKLGGQNKFPRVMKGKRFAEWDSFVHRRARN